MVRNSPTKSLVSKRGGHVHTQGGRITRSKKQHPKIESIKHTYKSARRKITTTTTMRNKKGNKLHNPITKSHAKRRTTKHVERRR